MLCMMKSDLASCGVKLIDFVFIYILIVSVIIYLGYAICNISQCSLRWSMRLALEDFVVDIERFDALRCSCMSFRLTLAYEVIAKSLWLTVWWCTST